MEPPQSSIPVKEILAARSVALAERVKELRCLHSISGLLNGRHDLGYILERVAVVLPSAWQHPELARAVVTLRGRRYPSTGADLPPSAEGAEILVDGAPAGTLEVGYVGTLPDGRQPEFLPEERDVLETVAERIGEIVSLDDVRRKLRTYEENLRSLASALTLTEERERRALALSLHDRIGQALALAKLKLETLRQTLPPQYTSRLDDVSELIKQTVSDTRDLTFDISPPILYELGFRQAVIWLGEHVSRLSGLVVEVRAEENLIALTEDVSVMLFRSVQELLTNSVKHAHASRAVVRLLNDVDEVCVIVEDDGTGFDVAQLGLPAAAAGGYGLFSVRERIGYLGGRVTIESGPDRGTRVQISVPGADAVEGA